MAIKSATRLDLSEDLVEFQRYAKQSKEYQGDGFGISWRTDQGLQDRHSLIPVWDADLSSIGPTDYLMIHARSAFDEETIAVENNMPFTNERLTFIFNGELRGVKIREEGRIGAEKLFNYLCRFVDDDIKSGLERGIKIVEKKTDYIRAMNFIIADNNDFFVCNYYNEDQNYFTLHITEESGKTIVSSEPFGNYNWSKLSNKEVKKIT